MEFVVIFKFAENQTIDDISKVPAEFQCCYVEDGETYKLASDNPVVASLVKNVTSLTGTVTKLRTEVDSVKAQRFDLSELSEWGTTPTEIAAKFAEEKNELSAKAPKTEEWQAKLNQQRVDMTTQHTAQLTAKDGQIAGLNSALENELVTARSVAALAAHKGSPELLMGVITQHVKVVRSDDGKYSTQVVGEDGTARFNATGENMSLPELVGELKADPRYARAFESEAPQGGNTRPGSTSGGHSRNNGGKDERSSNDKIASGLASGGATRVN
jgi:hypothetical protein